MPLGARLANLIIYVAASASPHPALSEMPWSSVVAGRRQRPLNEVCRHTDQRRMAKLPHRTETGEALRRRDATTENTGSV